MPRNFLFTCFIPFALFFFSYGSAEIVISPSYASYEIITLLGTGEKAEVFLAKEANGRFAVLKRLYSKEQLKNKYPAEYLDRLFNEDGSSITAEREFSISQLLIHPRILKIYDLFTSEDADLSIHTYLVMEYVEGKTLKDTPIKSQTKQAALRNAIQFVDALKYATEQRFIHADLYSSNLMFDQNGQVKLIDLDSFEEWPHGEDREANEEPTNQEYFSVILRMVARVLECGDFEEEANCIMSQDLKSLLSEEPYSKELKQEISWELTLAFLEELSGRLKLFD